MARWLEILSEFQFSIEHRAGRKHGNADGLSRIVHQVDTCKQCTRLEKTNSGPSFDLVKSSHSVGVTSWNQGKLSDQQLLRDLVCPVGPVSRQVDELKEHQENSNDSVARVLKAIRDGVDIPEQELKQGKRELKVLWEHRDALLLDDHGVL